MDWLTVYDVNTLSKRDTFTNSFVGSYPGHPYGHYSEAISPITGQRVRNGHTTNPVLAGGIRRCSDYLRWSVSGKNFTPTIRSSGGANMAEIYCAYPPYTDFINFGNPPQGWANLDNSAVTEAMLRLSSAKVQLVNDLLEARQTFNLFADTASTAAKALIDLRRGRYGDLIRRLHPRDLPKNASRRWLEWIYGWVPLASELYSAQELVKAHRNTTKIVRVVREKRDRGFIYEPGFSGPLWDDLQNPAQLDYSSKVILYATMNNTYTNMAKDWGCYNPASIAWEAVPYSFIVDWFLPVGNVIEAWTASAGYTFLTGCITRRVSGNASPNWISKSGRFYWNGSTIHSRSTADFNFKYVKRNAYSTFPTPLPYTKSPFSTSHAATALALLHQVRK